MPAPGWAEHRQKCLCYIPGGRREVPVPHRPWRQWPKKGRPEAPFSRSMEAGSERQTEPELSKTRLALEWVAGEGGGLEEIG
jgi:hypothetical protein